MVELVVREGIAFVLERLLLVRFLQNFLVPLRVKQQFLVHYALVVVILVSQHCFRYTSWEFLTAGEIIDFVEVNEPGAISKFALLREQVDEVGGSLQELAVLLACIYRLHP